MSSSHSRKVYNDWCSHPDLQMSPVGLIAPILAAKESKTDDLVALLKAGLGIVIDKEPLTLEWFAVHYTDTTNYGIFDTFASEEGQTAHMTGDVAAALGAKSEELLSSPPKIDKVEILAQKVVRAQAPRVKIGLRVLLNAKPEKVDTVRAFLAGAVSLVEQEAETPVWYAIEFPGTGVFGILDFFEAESGRTQHVQGEVAKALFASADELLSTPPDIAKFDVVAVKV